MALMNKRYLVLLALLACLTGCVPVDSLNPLYTDKDVVFDESLLGDWVGSDNGTDGGLHFSRLQEISRLGPGYVVTMTGKPDEESMVLHARLVNLGGKQFLDIMPTQWDSVQNSYTLKFKSSQAGPGIEPRLLRLGRAFYLEFERGNSSGEAKANLRRAHWFARLIRADKTIQLAWADDDDVKRAVENRSMQLPAQLMGDAKSKDVVITASTEELRKFVAEHAEDGQFFSSKTSQLHRQK